MPTCGLKNFTAFSGLVFILLRLCDIIFHFFLKEVSCVLCVRRTWTNVCLCQLIFGYLTVTCRSCRWPARPSTSRWAVAPAERHWWGRGLRGSEVYGRTEAQKDDRVKPERAAPSLCLEFANKAQKINCWTEIMYVAMTIAIISYQLRHFTVNSFFVLTAVFIYLFF